MFKKICIALTLATAWLVPPAQAENGRYASVNGLRMYYEIHGSGAPLVLLHGAFTSIDTAWPRLLPALAEKHRVVAVELQGHGHTGDIDRPLSYAAMADDVAGLLRQLNLGEADLFGWSMGGTVALGVAIRHPDVVRKVTVVGAIYSMDGWEPDTLEGFKKLPPDFAPPVFKEPYDRIAPDPSQWPVLVAKVKRMALEFPGWSPADLRAVRAPLLVIMGDREGFRPEHAVSLYRLVPSGQLAILPGTDHFTVWTAPEWVLSITSAFLSAPMPSAK